MLSRTEAVERLIILRRELFPDSSTFPASDEEETESFDQLMIDIIGPSAEKSDRIIEIINLGLCGRITARTAAVAIQELASRQETGSRYKRSSQATPKNRSPAVGEDIGAENLEALQKRGWNT